MSDVLEVVLDATKCQGYGLCLGIAPDVFDIPPGEHFAVLLRSTFAAADRPRLLEAVRSCPAQAISLAE